MLTGFARENRTWRPVAQRLMQPLLVVEIEPSADAPARLDHRVIRLEENLFVFQASPKPPQMNGARSGILQIPSKGRQLSKHIETLYVDPPQNATLLLPRESAAFYPDGNSPGKHQGK
jgi:hypothetical protein